MDSWLPARRHQLAHALDVAYVDVRCSEDLGQSLAPRPLRPGPAAIEVERGHAMLRIGVTGQVRLREHHEACDSTRSGEDMKLRIVQRMEIELAEDAPE